MTKGNLFTMAWRENGTMKWKITMNVAQQVAKNTDLWQSIESIADNEALMRRLTRYAKRLAKENEDETLMSKEEFFARVDEARREIDNGNCITFNSPEEMNEWLNSL